MKPKREKLPFGGRDGEYIRSTIVTSLPPSLSHSRNHRRLKSRGENHRCIVFRVSFERDTVSCPLAASFFCRHANLTRTRGGEGCSNINGGENSLRPSFSETRLAWVRGTDDDSCGRRTRWYATPTLPTRLPGTVLNMTRLRSGSSRKVPPFILIAFRLPSQPRDSAFSEPESLLSSFERYS